ncbi:MAG TPA: Crp/Fnr family transcriptional regulator [Caulobacteraceae bacterium]|nr:Crp/Fnr family transcriptional regulator [Caulobacteraceae bacterium]
MAPDEIRIRAIPAWEPVHGEEAPFLPLSADERAELRRFGQAISFKTPKTQIFGAGDDAHYLYLLTDGVAEAYRVLQSGERQIVAFYWPGDILGLAEEGSYVSSVDALTPCTVYRFPADGMTNFLIEHPTIEHKFYVKAVHDLRNAQRQLIMMGRLSVQKRLAAFLVDCSAHEDYFNLRRSILTLPMTRYDIADYIGTSSEVVTRGLGHLERMGIIHRLSPRTLELKTADLRAFVNLTGG